MSTQEIPLIPSLDDTADPTTSGGQELGAPRGTGHRLMKEARVVAPGIVLSLAAAALAWGVSMLVPSISAMLSAILLGMVAANTGVLPAFTAPGISFAAKKFLRLGIVFLGLQLVLGDILALGAPMLLVIVCVVAGGILGTLAIGKALRVPMGLRLLIACGFSICGAAAVAGVAGVTDPDDEHEEDTVTAVALVVIFGTLMIGVIPLLSSLMGLDVHRAGMWAGASVHEIAQVVAVGGILGGGALSVAVIVKLARVLLLAPVAAILSVRQRRIVEAEGAAGATRVKMPPLVPLFVLAFLVMVLLRSFLPLSSFVLTTGKLAQTVLLAAAMFGLGCGVKVKSLMKVGASPFLLATLATVLVSSIAFVGVSLVG